MHNRVAGAVVLMAALGIAAEAARMPLGQASLPGPGLLPLAAALALALLAVALLLTTMKSGAPPRPASTAGRDGPAAMLVAALVAYGLLLPRLGYLLGTGALVATLLLIERQRWTIVLGVAVVASLGSYVLFAVWLQVPLPRDPWVR